jgi:RNA polymerase sigma-70 factor, ECF subfamily
MNSAPSAEHTTKFEMNRGRLRRLAYRLLGTVDDVDDVVQETYLKWHGTDPREVRTVEAWLTTAITRLCIDRLRQRRREQIGYTGSWLPEPLYVTEPLLPDHRLDLTSDLSMALLILLERLSPEERAVYLLHDAFDYGYREISGVVGKTESACRQLLHRARKRVQEDRPRFAVGGTPRRHLVLKFLEALQTADYGLLLRVLEDDATITPDGGGKVRAALNVVRGSDRIARLLLGIKRKYPGAVEERLMDINGEPGIIAYIDRAPKAVFAFETSETAILAIYRIVNPAKLRLVPALSSGGASTTQQVWLDSKPLLAAR